MKNMIKILCSLFVIALIAFFLLMVIGGRDLPSPDVSDLLPDKHIIQEDQNAFRPLMNYADNLTLPSDLNPLIAYIEGKTIFTPLIVEILKKNEPFLSDIHQALLVDHCQAPTNENTGYLSKYLQIAILLTVQAAHDRDSGRLSNSVEATIALLRFGNMLHVDAYKLTDFGIAVRILQLGLNQAIAAAQMEHISTEDLKRLFDTLSGLNSLDQGLIRAFKFKFMEVTNQIDSFRSNRKSLEETFSDTALLPFIIRKTTWYPCYLFRQNETKQKLAEVYRDTIQNIPLFYNKMKIYDLAHHLGLFGSKTAFLLKPNLVGKLFYAFTTPEIQTYLEGKCQMEGSIQGARLITAIQSFKRSHSGRLPHQLTDLCPDYFISVPLDPFDGKPFRYSPSKGIIYSVGKDLKDSGGSTEIPPGEIYGDDYPRTWIAYDGVFKIDS